MSKRKMSLLFLLMSVTLLRAQSVIPEYSTAGFFEIENSGRQVYNFNVGWRFIKGNIKDAEQPSFDDSLWELVNVPHGLEVLPDQASGGVNYQGPAWYRKHFELQPEMKGKKLKLHFEAVMGKSKVYLNGHLLREFYGGYLPIIVDISDDVHFDKENVLAVWADNSDDPMFPPGKSQNVMDFTYFGGIYRDVYLVESNTTYITDPNFVDKVADGGVFVRFENVSEKSADVIFSTNILNEAAKNQKLSLVAELHQNDGTIVGTTLKDIRINSGASKTISQRITVNRPKLWSPDSPYLYKLILRVKRPNGTSLDGYEKRIGIRTIHFDNKKGFFLNGQHFPEKLLGANRHQDFASIGNALPNSLQWRDVKKLRDAGFRIIRSAHYPQDPAFMDACDELGMFIIVATPGWQFWNSEPIFEQRVVSDIRQMVRRDRNHPSVLMWEPILNETHYPDDFAKKVHDVVHEEYPFAGAYTACDKSAKGSEYFDIVYRGAPDYNHVTNDFTQVDDKVSWRKIQKTLPLQCFFTREWGDNVDDWSSHNSPSRVCREWGENAQIIQALHYAKPINYNFYSLENLYFPSPKYIGGTIWHSFDHQRGYHPDPFYGGIMDAYRQPKYAYQMFCSQRDPRLQLKKAESGPFIYIAHELTPFSSNDVLVFSNCDEVRLIYCGKDTIVQRPDRKNIQIQHPYLIFKDVFDFMDIKALHRNKKFDEAYVKAEGIIDGKVVVTDTRRPSKRASKIRLHLDNENVALLANGSDIVTVVAMITDQDGIVKRLNNEYITFTIEGEGKIIGQGHLGHDTRKVEWGTAPILIQSSNQAGKITVRAHLLFEGINKAIEGSLEFESMEVKDRMIFSELPSLNQKKKQYSPSVNVEVEDLKRKLRDAELELRDLQIKQVEKDQHEIEKLRIGK